MLCDDLHGWGGGFGEGGLRERGDMYTYTDSVSCTEETNLTTNNRNNIVKQKLFPISYAAETNQLTTEMKNSVKQLYSSLKKALKKRVYFTNHNKLFIFV